MNLRDVVMELIWPQNDDIADRSKEENAPRERKNAMVAGQAMVTWMQEFGGSHLIKMKAQGLEAKIHSLVLSRRVTQDEREMALGKLDEIANDLKFVHEIIAAVEDSERLKAEITGPARDTKGDVK